MQNQIARENKYVYRYGIDFAEDREWSYQISVHCFIIYITFYFLLWILRPSDNSVLITQSLQRQVVQLEVFIRTSLWRLWRIKNSDKSKSLLKVSLIHLQNSYLQAFAVFICGKSSFRCNKAGFIYREKSITSLFLMPWCGSYESFVNCICRGTGYVQYTN